MTKIVVNNEKAIAQLNISNGTYLKEFEDDLGKRVTILFTKTADDKDEIDKPHVIYQPLLEILRFIELLLMIYKGRTFIFNKNF